jgi:polyisoprenoid-binding protein YceI
MEAEQTMSTITERALPTGTWNVDPVHSQVGFAVDYMIGTFRGSFSPVEATLVVAEDGSIELAGSARVENVKVQDENLAGHLQTPDFFDAERNPTISFTGKDFRRSGNDVTVDGELTIKGITRPVELTGTITDPIADPFGGTRLGLNLSTTVDRTAFGLEWNNPLPSGEPALANDVTLTAELFLVKA